MRHRTVSENHILASTNIQMFVSCHMESWADILAGTKLGVPVCIVPGRALNMFVWSGIRKIHGTSIFQYIVGPRKNICSIRCIQYVHISFWTLRQKTKTQPKKLAAFGGRLLVMFRGLKYSHFLEVQEKNITS